LTVYLCTGAY